MGFLTPREQRRLAEVTAMLERGENPFSHITERKGNADAGGLDRDRKVRNLEAIASKPHPILPATRELLRSPNSKNFSVPEGTIVPAGSVLVPIGMVRCSFCGLLVKDDHRVTRGRGPLQKTVKRDIVWDSSIHRIDHVEATKMVHFRVPVVACSECVLEIKTYTTSKGDVIPSGQVWPEYD